MSGLLIAGHIVDVPGVAIANPHDTPWCKLDGRDYRARRTPWVRQVTIHTTKGIWPQSVRLGMGKPGADKIVADFWRGDPNHSAAHIVIDRDGSVACLADLAAVCAYHATTVNDWSVGIEMYQESDGAIYEAVFDACVKIVPAICEALSIAFQVAQRVYDGRPISRMINGGPDCVGIFGHRDNAWDPIKQTSTRGRGDPGDLIYTRLIAAGAEPFDYALRQDLYTWQQRQRAMNALGEQLKVDGIAGPSTIAAMRRRGFANGKAIDSHTQRTLYFCPCGRSSSTTPTLKKCTQCGGAMSQKHP